MLRPAEPQLQSTKTCSGHQAKPTTRHATRLRHDLLAGVLARSPRSAYPAICALAADTRARSVDPCCGKAPSRCGSGSVTTPPLDRDTPSGSQRCPRRLCRTSLPVRRPGFGASRTDRASAGRRLRSPPARYSAIAHPFMPSRSGPFESWDCCPEHCQPRRLVRAAVPGYAHSDCVNHPAITAVSSGGRRSRRASAARRRQDASVLVSRSLSVSIWRTDLPRPGLWSREPRSGNLCGCRRNTVRAMAPRTVRCLRSSLRSLHVIAPRSRDGWTRRSVSQAARFVSARAAKMPIRTSLRRSATTSTPVTRRCTSLEDVPPVVELRWRARCDHAAITDSF
jgi:hypothetical protein